MTKTEQALGQLYAKANNQVRGMLDEMSGPDRLNVQLTSERNSRGQEPKHVPVVYVLKPNGSTVATFKHATFVLSGLGSGEPRCLLIDPDGNPMHLPDGSPAIIDCIPFALQMDPGEEHRMGIRAVEELTGLSESTIERSIADGDFPKPYYQGARRLWRYGDLIVWLGSRPREYWENLKAKQNAKAR
jgi:predicted DNA-binding transcriptional regulator AlpA